MGQIKKYVLLQTKNSNIDTHFMNRNLYIISYDLKTPGKDYNSLYDAIKQYGEWRHPLESTWLVFTDSNANAISTNLRANGRMDDSDLLFVCQLNINDTQGWIDKSVWNWIDGLR